MHNRRTAAAAVHDLAGKFKTAAAAPAVVATAPKDASSSSLLSSGTMNTTGTTALSAQQHQTSLPDSKKLQSEKYFRITDITGTKATQVGTTLTWQEDQLLRPANDSAAKPSDWKLVKLDAGSGEHMSETDSMVYWVTTCGYLRWLKGRREVKYTAEVDGCSVSCSLRWCLT
jgi:hypothetical protein